jgi:hypothetical protein
MFIEWEGCEWAVAESGVDDIAAVEVDDTDHVVGIGDFTVELPADTSRHAGHVEPDRRSTLAGPVYPMRSRYSPSIDST